MIKTISLENFKGFKELKKLKLKPITLLTGTNSCGKSSILQSLLLLKQTVESKNINQTLLLNGRFVHLGTFENIIYNKQTKNPIKLGICFNVKKEDLSKNFNGSLPLHILLRELISNESFDAPKVEYQFNYDIWVKIQNNENNKRKAYLKPISVEKVLFSINVKSPDGQSSTESLIEIIQKNDDIYDVRSSNLYSRYYRFSKENDKLNETKPYKITFANLFPISFESQKSDANFIPVQHTFFLLNDLFRQVFSSITYIGPLREEPARRYIYEDEVVEIGIKGENAAYIFISEQDNIVSDFHFLDNNENDFIKVPNDNISLLEAMTKWNNLMKIEDFKAENINEIIQLNLDTNNGSKTRVNIADVGFGVSQIFPILLEGLRMNSGGTMILEQPEIHLHPNLQMHLADYFISLALSGKNVIIETHSDHMVNRLVRRIIEDDKYGLKDLIAMYFIQSSENGSVFNEVEVDEKRGIVNWPKEFFDQTANEQEKIIMAAIDKRRKI